MQDLVVHLLAYNDPHYGQIAKWGAAHIQVPIIPPGLEINYTSYPVTGYYAQIIFWQRLSPRIVPDTLELITYHSGIEVQAGLLTDMVTSESYDSWMVLKENDPVRTKIINQSTVNQYYETAYQSLLIDTEAHYRRLLEIMDHWSGGKK